ncbi:MAG: hypothetical protein R3E89_13695 [Thiolinea sp.]
MLTRVLIASWNSENLTETIPHQSSVSLCKQNEKGTDYSVPFFVKCDAAQASGWLLLYLLHHPVNGCLDFIIRQCRITAFGGHDIQSVQGIVVE